MHSEPKLNSQLQLIEILSQNKNEFGVVSQGAFAEKLMSRQNYPHSTLCFYYSSQCCCDGIYHTLPIMKSVVHTLALPLDTWAAQDQADSVNLLFYLSVSV